MATKESSPLHITYVEIPPGSVDDADAFGQLLIEGDIPQGLRLVLVDRRGSVQFQVTPVVRRSSDHLRASSRRLLTC